VVDVPSSTFCSVLTIDVVLFVLLSPLRFLPFPPCFTCATVLFPLVTYGGIVLLAAVWLIIGILLQTAGSISSTSLLNETASAAAAANSALASSNMTNNVTTNFNVQSSYAQVEEMDVINYLWLYHIFMGLWVNAFIQGVAMLSIAGSVGKWYFTPVSVMKKNQGRCPVCKSYCITCRFHLGTVAFGSLIIALVQLVRLIVGYIQKKMDEAGESKIKKAIMCVVQCCLWCLEKCMKFISKNSYIYTALSGTSFCYSAFKSFFLILNNLGKFLPRLRLHVVGKAKRRTADVFLFCLFCFFSFLLCC
jgi:choline transporter-like protein 2/4/5